MFDIIYIIKQLDDIHYSDPRGYDPKGDKNDFWIEIFSDPYTNFNGISLKDDKSIAQGTIRIPSEVYSGQSVQTKFTLDSKYHYEIEGNCLMPR